MPQIVSSRHLEMAQKLRLILARYQEIELLVRVGEYQKGQDLEPDDALKRYPAVCAFLKQKGGEYWGLEKTLNLLEQTVIL